MNKHRENCNVLEIYSDTKYLREVDIFLRDFFHKNFLTPKFYNRFYLCLSEAVVNSIVHGNKNDSSKKVKIEIYKDNQFVYFRITDQGFGFNSNTIIDPTCLDNIKREWGRGLHIIKTYADEIKFYNEGRTIELKIGFCE